MSTTTRTPAPTSRTNCDPQTAVTRSLLGYGVLAGPVYVVTSLTQGLLRPGFDLSRHEWSLLSNGSLGWIQIANFILTGALYVAFAVGLRRSLASGRGSRWAPRLVAVFGLGLIGAGVLRADPALGFPVGTPQSGTPISWHGFGHFISGGIGFTAIAIGCLVLGARYAAEGRTVRAWMSRLTGIAFFAGFAMIASAGGAPGANLVFTALVILLLGWLTAVAVDRYRRTH